MCEKCAVVKKELTKKVQDGIAICRKEGTAKALDQKSTRLMAKVLGMICASPMLPLIDPMAEEQLYIIVSMLIQHAATLEDMAPDPAEDEPPPPPTPDSLPDSIHDLPPY